MSSPEKKEDSQAKKAYRSPVIHYYGSIQTITGSMGSTAMNDGAMTGVNRKTA